MPVHHNLLGRTPERTDRIRNYIANADLGARSCSAHENVLLPNAIIPPHRHSVEEVVVCLGGEATCQFEGEKPEPYRAGSVLIIPPNTIHTIRNSGKSLLRQISFFAGNPTGTEWTSDEGSVMDIQNGASSNERASAIPGGAR